MTNPFGRRDPASYRLLRRIDQKAFDGNLTDAITNWLFPLEGTIGLADDTFDILMETTVDDSALGWVLFPPERFRL